MARSAGGSNEGTETWDRGTGGNLWILSIRLADTTDELHAALTDRRDDLRPPIVCSYVPTVLP